jgi:NitT/TauT family transport system permease protein
MPSDIMSLLVYLIISVAASWGRMFIALFISIFIAVCFGLWAAMSEGAEKVILPIVDVLQTLPILAFFPFAIFVIVASVPGYIGINAAVIMLIITSMVWNIIFGVYESIKLMPNELLELGKLYKMGFWKKLREVFIPACLPSVVEQSKLSWAIGLFYLVTSEIFSTGSANYKVVHGIGVALTTLAEAGNTTGYILGVVIFIIAVVLTRLFFFGPLENYSNRYRIKKHVTHQKAMHTSFLERHLLRYWKAEGRAFSGLIKRTPDKTIHVAGKAFNPKIKYIAIVASLLIFMGLIWILGLVPYELQIIQALSYSFVRVWLAFIVSLIIAVPLCVYLVFFSKHSNSYTVLFQILASIPATILLPAIIIALRDVPGAGEITAFVIFVLSGIWYLIFSMMSSSKAIPANIFEVRKLWKVKGSEAWRKIYIMALLPGIITGSITAIAAEWNASIIAEYFTGTQVNIGIGKLLDISLSQGNLVLMGLAVINMVVMIILINTFVWKRLYSNVSKVYK